MTSRSDREVFKGALAVIKALVAAGGLPPRGSFRLKRAEGFWYGEIG
jgi:hypothetical protein